MLRDGTGRVVLTLEEGDYSRLLATGWQYPTHFVAKGRDGVTPVHGLLFFPTDYDPDGSYPVVDYIYPGPQVGPIRGHLARVQQGGNAQSVPAPKK